MHRYRKPLVTKVLEKKVKGFQIMKILRGRLYDSIFHFFFAFLIKNLKSKFGCSSKICYRTSNQYWYLVNVRFPVFLMKNLKSKFGCSSKICFKRFWIIGKNYFLRILIRNQKLVFSGPNIRLV